MTPERGIALAAFAIGLAVVVLALFGCGDEVTDPSRTVACEVGDLMPVAGVELAEDGESVRFAYAGAEPCTFGVDLYKGTLYVELRTRTEYDEIDRSPPVPSGCAVGRLNQAVSPGTPVETLSGGRRLLPDSETERLLSADLDCSPLPQGEPGFIID